MTNECEVCGSKSLSLVLDLGQHPLCDDLVPINDLKKCKEYPIRILLCDECKTALQDVEVDKVELDLVWEPPWDKSMMSEAAKLELNL